MARDKRDEVHTIIDANFDMVDVAMAIRRLTSLNCCYYWRWCCQDI